ncbi:tRNA 2-selenouridine synthase SelU [Paenibacillus larvae subsp. larvae]|uniref:tRNA 2-selenouridine synthase SelU n=1 Tax=Paenibacillus larvae subsp. larvae TaxID=147375 RepID=A0A2L1UB55_9BACL|nr:tRNA 2-selenouridine(34) synthase MnmH [Paenibacillus larvae]AQT85939.1 tRNA 2-selenouridine(34) synthase MnmH [Paenibacillus larvae subsp. pulvifaciens]AVF25382.1 tRNA 2-selenouridine synthase SelU [Paenibacillus larvae subsp. larvae]AVF30159.1 tRNA 2-selenouridine synthase SelU [Paenibacillus larvae subsp. larvae]MBH0342701.1 tRNA 2-selenouridine synthase [Paenibacillus larvae]MCY7520801.1 tRNA 2-selenouridine(34) synthase MnmH [Paenibacillus larvae]
MFQDITIQELLELQERRDIQLIDVRSPREFVDFTIPGSRNIPLFSDEERREIGILYKQVSIQAAKEKGLEVVSAKLPAFIRQFAEIPGRKAVFCWRGGMRSRTTATVLSLMDIHVSRLQGGIRAYRKWVVETLGKKPSLPPCIVIGGHTGIGKTQMLRKLADEGYPVLDLEEMAGHRGSIFGQTGLEANNQKTFEALFVEGILQWKDAPFVLVEAESKRIGKVVLPDFLVTAKEAGQQIILRMPIKQRVRHIIEEYKPDLHKEEYISAFRRIKSRIHTPIARQIEQDLLADRFEEAVELLLEYYYDPRYLHAEQNYALEPIVCKVEDIEDAIIRVKTIMDRFYPSKIKGR